MSVRVYCLLIRKAGQLPPRYCFWLGTPDLQFAILQTHQLVRSRTRRSFPFSLQLCILFLPKHLGFFYDLECHVFYGTLVVQTTREDHVPCGRSVSYDYQLRVPAVFVQVDRLLAIVVGDGNPVTWFHLLFSCSPVPSSRSIGCLESLPNIR